MPTSFKQIEETTKTFEEQKIESSKEIECYSGELLKVMEEERAKTDLIERNLKEIKESSSNIDKKLVEVNNNIAQENVKYTKTNNNLQKNTDILNSQIGRIISKSILFNRN